MWETYGFAEIGALSRTPPAIRKLYFLPSDLDALCYIASHGDLIQAFGANVDAGRQHYSEFGKAEGRKKYFDPERYLQIHSDLQKRLTSLSAACEHYIQVGFAEGRATR